MADGSVKPIEDVAVGDTVISTDPGTGKTTTQQVQLLHINHDTDLTDVKVAIQKPVAAPASKVKVGVGHGAGTVRGPTTVATLHTTQHHPFWDQTDRKWVDARDLKTGHRLRTDTGAVATVIAVTSYTAPTLMRDLTVSTIHTYYVVAGTTPVLVHNTGPCPHVDYDAVPEDLRPHAENVIRQMDKDGTLPPGVEQGGSRAGEGIYSGGGLPPGPPKYYVETDLHPRLPGAPKRPERGRLIFGGRGEIWYSDHYDDGFVQIRGSFCGCQ